MKEKNNTKEQFIKEASNFLENTFSTILDGIMVTNAQGEIVRTNKAVEQMLGFPADELIGKRTGELSVRDEEHRKKCGNDRAVI